jgi:Asp-tRNA(Asn)/Glu-tRNA(Gln) amidotransferase B subunit
VAKTEIEELSEFIRDHMLTKDAAREVVAEVLDTKLTAALLPITNELAVIHRDLDHLTETVDNVLGYRKEIDHALERIAAIEKRLGAGASEVAA